MAEAMLRRPLPARTFLNINVPKGEPKGYRVTVQAKRNHVTSVAERHDPKGRPNHWIEEGQDPVRSQADAVSQIARRQARQRVINGFPQRMRARTKLIFPLSIRPLQRQYNLPT